MAADDVSVDLEDRDLVFDRADDSTIMLDLDDRDLVLDPTEGDIVAEFSAAVGGITADALASSLAPIETEITAEAQARTSADVMAGNRLNVVEHAVGADPGDLTLLFNNGLV